MDTPRIAALEAGSYPRLLEIWRGAVRATHHFITPEYFAWIEARLASDFFPQVELWGAFVSGEGPERLAAFMGLGLSGEVPSVEMLFVDPLFHRRGLGGALLERAKAHPRLLLDVNEQNAGALAFYRKQGFSVIGRSEVDSAGKPYPLLHMEFRRA